MNKVTIIKGKRQSGKTTELVSNFKKLIDEISVEPDIGYRAHFIKCVVDEEYTPQEYIDKFIQEFEIDTEPLGNGNRITVVSSKEDLLVEIYAMINKSDCHIFIDDPDLLIGKTDFENEYYSVHDGMCDLVDKYPNNKTCHSLDITYTDSKMLTSQNVVIPKSTMRSLYEDWANGLDADGPILDDMLKELANIDPERVNAYTSLDGEQFTDADIINDIKLRYIDKRVSDCKLETDSLKEEACANTSNLLLVDFNITNVTMNDLEGYLNVKEIPYVTRVDRDDDSDVEFHITTDDVQSMSEFKNDLNIVGNIDNVDKIIIYNK